MASRKILFSVLIFAASPILLAIYPLYAALRWQLGGQVALGIEPATPEGTYGDQVMVEVTAENASEMAGIQFQVVYDSAVARAVSVERGNLPEAVLFQGSRNAGNSTLAVAIASPSSFGAAYDPVALAKITPDIDKRAAIARFRLRLHALESGEP